VAGALTLNGPPGVIAVLAGNLEVVAKQPNWPTGQASFGEKGLRCTGNVNVMVMGDVSAIAFQLGHESAGKPNPVMTYDCRMPNGEMRQIGVLYWLNGQKLPAFGNTGPVAPNDALYGFGVIQADVVIIGEVNIQQGW